MQPAHAIKHAQTGHEKLGEAQLQEDGPGTRHCREDVPEVARNLKLEQSKVDEYFSPDDEGNRIDDLNTSARKLVKHMQVQSLRDPERMRRREKRC